MMTGDLTSTTKARRPVGGNPDVAAGLNNYRRLDS